MEGYEFYVVEGARMLISHHMPHIIMELQPRLVSSMPPRWDAASGREISGAERIKKWFNFLRTDLKYSVFYIPWEHIKYPPHSSTGYGELFYCFTFSILI